MRFLKRSWRTRPIPKKSAAALSLRVSQHDATSARAKHLLGETTRELGILMLVFAPLESTFADRPLDVEVLMSVIALSVTLIGCGILIEASDR
jgi:hypothetical protein